jgi:tRNA:m4X modification enzyme
LFLDGISFQSTYSIPIPTDRSIYSKQRLFSIEHQEQIGLKAKRILDWGRIEYLNKNGFNAHLKVYASKNITLENIALIATPIPS